MRRTGHEIAADQQDAGRWNQPEGHGVQPREGHVAGSHIERDQIVPEGPIHHRYNPEEDHHRAVQGEHFVVGLPGEEIGNRCDQLGADCSGEGPTDQIEEEATNQVLQADHFVIGAEAEVAQPALWLQRF